MSNTSILIKRSTGTSVPTNSSLRSGELAYSYASNTAFIGGSDGVGVLKIGGQAYTSQIDSATSAVTAGTLVKRDGNSAFYGTLYGNANTATVLQNGRNFSISGGDITAGTQGFDGSSAVVLNASLNTVSGLSAGSYGSTTAIPVVTVAANGRIMAMSTSTISTSFTVSDGSNSGTQAGGGTLTFTGGGGVTATVSGSGGNETVTFGTDSSVIRSNTAGLGVQTVSTDLTVAGNLIVNGTQTYVNTNTVTTNDSLLKLASNNTTADIVDIGFYGSSNTGAATVYHGLIREGSGGSNAGSFYLFKNLGTDPTGNTVSYAGLSKATLYADLGGSTGLPISTGVSGLGTGVATFLGSPSSANFYSAMTDKTGSGGTVVFSTSPTLTTPVLGAATGTSLNVSSGLVSTGVWSGTYSDGIIVDYTGGTGRISVGGSDGITLYNNADTTRSALMTISSGGVIGTATWQGQTIGVGYGGTGVTSFTTNGIVFGNSSSALQVTAAAGTSDQTYSNQILTVTNSGVPVWSSALDGGTF